MVTHLMTQFTTIISGSIRLEVGDYLYRCMGCIGLAFWKLHFPFKPYSILIQLLRKACSVMLPPAPLLLCPLLRRKKEQCSYLFLFSAQPIWSRRDGLNSHLFDPQKCTLSMWHSGMELFHNFGYFHPTEVSEGNKDLAFARRIFPLWSSDDISFFVIVVPSLLLLLLLLYCFSCFMFCWLLESWAVWKLNEIIK